MEKLLSNPRFQIALFVVFAAIMFNLNLNTPRTHFYSLIIQFGLTFGLITLLMRYQYAWKMILISGIGVRLLMIPGLPELSNDFYRFIWDGELLLGGVNPYAHTPQELMGYGSFLSQSYYQNLFDGMGSLSQANYSCYPVVNQLCFAIGALFSDNIVTNTIVLKVLIILADIGVFFLGTKILKLLGKSTALMGWYFINPYILLEFTANLHFEGVMLFFILLAIYMVMVNRWLSGAVALGLAIHVKLIPMMFIPFFYKKLGFKKALGFTAMVLIVVLLTGQLFLTPIYLDHFLQSVSLYFNNFQFNASIFNWINGWYSDYITWDTTQIVGPILGKIALVGIVLLGVLRADRTPNDFIKGILFALVIYYAFATTVHPWYISLILVFSLFTNYVFGIVWSALIMCSYWAYGTPEFTENTTLNTVVYLIVYGLIIYEIVKNWRKDAFGLQLKAFFTNKQAPKV